MRDTPPLVPPHLHLVTHDGGDCHHLDLCHLDKDCDADVATYALVLPRLHRVTHDGGDSSTAILNVLQS